MEIRNSEIKDIDDIISLLKECEMFADYLDTKVSLSKKINLDKQSILIATEKDKILGCVFIILDPWLPHIYRLCVKESVRDQGLGGKLLDSAENVIKARGYKIINIFIEEEKSGLIEFYKKRGFYEFVKCTNMEKQL